MYEGLQRGVITQCVGDSDPRIADTGAMLKKLFHYFNCVSLFPFKF